MKIGERSLTNSVGIRGVIWPWPWPWDKRYSLFSKQQSYIVFRFGSIPENDGWRIGKVTKIKDDINRKVEIFIIFEASAGYGGMRTGRLNASQSERVG